MDVVVDQIVAVLQVLTFGNTVGGNKDVQFICAPWKQTALPLETGEKQVRTVLRSARSFGMVVLPSTVPVISAVSSPKLLLGKPADIHIKVIGGIGKSGKDDDFPVARVNGMLHLFLDEVKQCLQLGVVFWRNIRYHQA